MAYEELREWIETIQDPQDKAAWYLTINKLDGVTLSSEPLPLQVAVGFCTLGIANVLSAYKAKKEKNEGMLELELLQRGINPLTQKPLNITKNIPIQQFSAPEKREHIPLTIKDQMSESSGVVKGKSTVISIISIPFKILMSFFWFWAHLFTFTALLGKSNGFEK